MTGRKSFLPVFLCPNFPTLKPENGNSKILINFNPDNPTNSPFPKSDFKITFVN